MPIPSAFHSRIAPLCQSFRWKDWAGYAVVASYDHCHEREYFAIRHAAGLIDVTPLFKYEVSGPDASSFLDFIAAKKLSRLKLGQVTYCCWCDEAGKVIDDGTVTRWDEQFYGVTAAEPTLAWFLTHSRGFQIDIQDVTDNYGILAVQGPMSREILKQVVDIPMDALRFFRAQKGKADKIPVTVSRTGYTGDLGYEVWCPWDQAPKLWDRVYQEGRRFGAEAAGMDAMDVTRIEAGFIMNGVDYNSANHCLIESRKSSPYEISLGWTVQLDRENFMGQSALKKEIKSGSPQQVVGLDIDWLELEEQFHRHGLPPELSSAAWRCSIPVYNRSMQYIGYGSSGAWSPTLKKNLALAHLLPEYSKPGTEVLFEILVEHQRQHIKATVVPMPFFNPERKRSNPNVH